MWYDFDDEGQPIDNLPATVTPVEIIKVPNTLRLRYSYAPRTLQRIEDMTVY
jgi:hypothetical protein